jgi:DNA invertase Pin-like site-specific DNA recombinase
VLDRRRVRGPRCGGAPIEIVVEDGFDRAVGPGADLEGALGRRLEALGAVVPRQPELVSEVALGAVGIILGLEVSRLARNSADWRRLIELCSLTDALILAEDGVYDPTSFNDRLLLGLKGTMSEAELHVLKARMRGGQLSKAQRGELEMAPPVGLAARNDGKIVLDPDANVQSVIRLVFDAFERTGSAFLTVRFLREENILFPRRLRCGPAKGDLLWAPAQHSRILQVLHNPRYAGAFVYGRTRSQKSLDGGTSVRKVPREEWRFVIPDMHEGYIDWDRFEANQRKLAENARLFGSDRRSGPAREGPGCRGACCAACAGSA